MKNILYIPLDERPCNANFPILLSAGTEYNLITPPPALSGDKKTPAQTHEIWEWIFENINAFDTAILSIDMLVYGGIVPSRIHSLSKADSISSLDNLRCLKKLKPDLIVYAFNLIMRCPSYSSSDEEPMYYETYGAEIFNYGILSHKQTLNSISDVELKEFDRLAELIPSPILKDYVDRREINKQVNMKTINLVKENLIDFLVIPQDDSAPLGFTAIDQTELKEYIHALRLDFKILMYPGADEVAMTLLARLINKDKGLTPLIYPRFSSTKGPFLIPLYEDRILMETLKYHVMAAGGILVDSLDGADIVLMMNTPAEKMYEAWDQNNLQIQSNSNKNLVEFVEFMDYIVNTKQLPCAVADVAYSNGGDLKLIHNMVTKNLLFKVAAYAGWNTNANTLGTVICQASLFNIYGKTKEHLDFLALRYVEDVGYCSFIRKSVTDNILPPLGLNYFEVDGKVGNVSRIVKGELQTFATEILIDENYSFNLKNLSFPWNRMFEVALEIEALLE